MTEPPGTGPPPSVEAEDREAMQFWGYLFKEDKCGTDMLNNLLSGLAIYVATRLSPNPCQDLLPSQLAALYKSVGGDYDSLFLETPHSTLSFIYKSLGALHSLQPAEDDDGYSGPSVPALKHKGFITWQTIQILLGPEEHVPFLQRAVQQFEIVNPENGQPFPKKLPSAAFPSTPDPDMLSWFDEVNERLTQEAQVEQKTTHPSAGLGAADPAADYSTDDSADEKSGAAKYFSNPFYRDGTGRPTVVRRGSRQRPSSPQRSLYERGKGMVRGVRHFISPSYRDTAPGGSRRSSYPERPVRQDAIYKPSDYDDILTPSTLGPDYMPPAERAAMRAASQRRPLRTPSTGTDTDSDGSPRSSRRPSEASPSASGGELSSSQKRTDNPRQDPRDYFPSRYPAEGRRHSAQAQSPSPGPHEGTSPGAAGGFGPSASPLFATQLGQAQTGRSSRDNDPRAPAAPRDRYNSRDTRDRDRRDGRESSSRLPTARRRNSLSENDHPPPSGRYAGPIPPPNRETDSADAYRVQSEQAGRPDRNRYSSSRDRDRDRDRRRSRSHPKEERPKMPRYVTPVDGVGGRRYVSPVWGDRWEKPNAVGGDAETGSTRSPLHRVGFAEGS